MSYSPSQQVTALVVAGGRSSRMGTDKALATWQGIPLLGRVFAVAQACCAQVSVLTPWPERYQTLLPSTVNWLVEPPTFAGPMAALVQGMEAIQTPWVLLLACDMPQLNGAVLMQWMQALPDAQIQSEHLAQPHPSPPLAKGREQEQDPPYSSPLYKGGLRGVMQSVQNQSNLSIQGQDPKAITTHHAIAYVPYHQNRWEPLCGFYHVDCLPSLKAFLAEQGDLASFQKWLQTIDAVPLAVDAAIAPMFFNCNTPKELTVD
jgi:molybdenum cofactor guanylyltransferase